MMAPSTIAKQKKWGTGRPSFLPLIFHKMSCGQFLST
jgi:hypothetical protein